MNQLNLFDTFLFRKTTARVEPMPTKKISDEVKGTTIMSVRGRNITQEDKEKEVGVKVLNRSGGGHLNIDRSELAPSLPPK